LEDGSKVLGLPTGKYHLFLFNDLIVLCTGTKAYKLKGSYQIKDSHVITQETPNSFIFETNEAILHFKSEHHVEPWVKDMQALINALVEDRKTRMAFEERPASSVWQTVSNFLLN